MMRLVTASSRVAVLLYVAGRSSSFLTGRQWCNTIPSSTIVGSQQRFPRTGALMSSSAGAPRLPRIRNIRKDAMEKILEDYEGGGDSKYVVIDVRSKEEVEYTGKLSPSVHTLPIEVIAEYDVFGMEDDEFEEVCGFHKPSLDETLVFTCAAGSRSMHACRLAGFNGYCDLINYDGGSSEWFSTGD